MHFACDPLANGSHHHHRLRQKAHLRNLSCIVQTQFVIGPNGLSIWSSEYDGLLHYSQSLYDYHLNLPHP